MTDWTALLEGFGVQTGATESEILKAEEQLGQKLPAGYREFLQQTNGGEGFIGKSPYAMLWRCEKLASLNSAYQTQDYAPGLLLFGSDGYGETFGFDTRDRWAIVRVPFIGMSWNYAESMGETFEEFLRGLYEVQE